MFLRHLPHPATVPLPTQLPSPINPHEAVPKKDDPYGRIIHNYSHKIDGISLNDCLVDNSTEYISFKGRVELLDPITWYIKLDLKDGYSYAQNAIFCLRKMILTMPNKLLPAVMPTFPILLLLPPALIALSSPSLQYVTIDSLPSIISLAN